MSLHEQPGRNDPCWCGSGRKYKHCHQRSDDTRRADVAMHHRVAEQLALYANRLQFRNEQEKAVEGYLPPSSERDDVTLTELDVIRAMDYFQFDYLLPGGERVVERFARERGRRLARDERAMVDAWLESYPGVFEVTGVTPGTGVRLRDLVSGETYDVIEHMGSRQIGRWQIVCTRIMRIGDHHEVWGTPLLVPPRYRERLRAMVAEEWEAYRERHPDGTYAECLRDMAPAINRFVLREVIAEMQQPPVLVTAEGDILTFCTALYDIVDPAQVRARLAAAPEYDCIDADTTLASEFTWVEAGESLDYLRRHGTPFEQNVTPDMEMGGVRSLGHITLTRQELRLETTSWRRNKAGQELLAMRLGGAIRFREATTKSLEDVLAEQSEGQMLGATLPGAQDDAPSPDVVELTAQMTAAYEGRWLDSPIPALGGRTPRAAAQTFGGRLALIRLLKDLEAQTQRAKTSGAMDAGRLSAALGIREQELLDESRVEEQMEEMLDSIADLAEEEHLDDALAQWRAFRERFPFRSAADLNYSEESDLAEVLSEDIAGTLADKLALRKRFEDAFAVIEECFAMGLDRDACDIARARVRIERGDDEEAVRTLRSIVERKPEDMFIILELGGLFTGVLRKPDDAIALYRFALDRSEDDLDRFTLVRELAHAYLQTDRIEEAERLWRKVYDRVGTTERDYAMLAQIQMARGDWAGARASAKHVAATLGGNYLLGLIESRAGNFAAARAAWGEDLLDVETNESLSLWVTSAYLLRLREFQRVIEQLTPHLAADADIYLRVALAYAGLGEMDKAREMAQTGRAELRRTVGRERCAGFLAEERKLATELGLDDAVALF